MRQAKFGIQCSYKSTHPSGGGKGYCLWKAASRPSGAATGIMVLLGPPAAAAPLVPSGPLPGSDRTRAGAAPLVRVSSSATASNPKEPAIREKAGAKNAAAAWSTFAVSASRVRLLVRLLSLRICQLQDAETRGRGSLNQWWRHVGAAAELAPQTELPTSHA